MWAGCGGVLFLDFGQEAQIGCDGQKPCIQGVCQANQCVMVPDGGACTQNADCQTNSCVARECGGSGLPTPSACTQDADCASGDCRTQGGQSFCTEPCSETGLCPRGAACFESLCVPPDYCFQELGPGCSGTTCERCSVDATCTNAGGGFECACLDGYFGDGSRCEFDNCTAEPSPCNDAGSCVDTTDGYSCLCYAGYFGDFCEIDNNDCFDGACLNNGECIDLDDAYRCNCVLGFSGTSCETNVDDCVGTPCQNGGTCVDGVNSITCQCPSGFLGDRCSFNPNDCPPSGDANACKNGSACVDLVNDFTCDCLPGFDGDDCGNNINECLVDPCVNGTCADGVGVAICTCDPGYSGPTCATEATCADDADCAQTQFCNAQSKCQNDTCTPGLERCHAGGVVRCADNGSGEISAYACTGRTHFSSACIEENGKAYCTCQDDWDCPAYTECSVDRCTGTGEEATCFLDPAPFDTMLPTNEISWGGTYASRNAPAGTPFPDSAQVVVSPVVANLDDDNNDGKIDERDFPEIVFLTFRNSEYTSNGTLRAIHGGGPNKGKDYFATCGTTVWHEGDDASITCPYAGDRELDATASVAVGDLDGDGVPEIVALGEGSGNATSNAPVVLFDNRGNVLARSANFNQGGANPGPALANLDQTGNAEIIVGRSVLTVNKTAGVWTFVDRFEGANDHGINSQGPVSCVADLAPNAGLEIAAGRTLYRWPTPPTGVSKRADCPPVAGLTGDALEWCQGRLISAWHAPTVPANSGKTITGEGFCAVADVLGFDQVAAPGPNNPLDGLPEVITIAGGFVQIFNGGTGALLRRISLSAGTLGGPPNVDDFDGDGFPEIGTAGNLAYIVTDLQSTSAACPAWTATTDSNTNKARTPPGAACSTDADCGDTSQFACNEIVRSCVCLHNSWRRLTEDDSSQVTGSTVFDFNGDGAAEVIYNDECFFRIYDGTNGAELYAVNSESRTRIEYPIVADVDNDGNAEIVFATSNESGFCNGDNGSASVQALYNNGIEVWGDASDLWVSARRIWNQHSYHVTHVTEAGGIPQYEPHSWEQQNGRQYNTYRSNPRVYGVAPDLIVDGLQVTAAGGGCGAIGSALTLVVTAKNDGDLRVGPGVVFTFEGDFGSGFVPLKDAQGDPLTRTVGNTLEPSNVVYLQVAYDAANNNQSSAPLTVRATIDATQRERECHEDNNSRQVSVNAAPSNIAELRVELGPVDENCITAPTVSTKVYNDGSVAASSVVVRFYAGDPFQGGQAIGDQVIPGAIAAQTSVTVAVSLAQYPWWIDARIFAIVDPSGVVPECNDGNNLASQAYATHCRGPGG